ncbi:MAG TPA: redox-regulated ATPase YchF [Acidobacteriaceae bacterium]|jgi:GTP-binding protein YchF|nr:redox-regulated ATPase YchF [Acidobacteriaceae bacterium]
MKTGIIGLPQVGKTSLFKILTKAKTENFGHSREAHIGIAKVPDHRLDKLAAQAKTRKTVYATVEYADLAAIGEEALKETSFLTSLRNVDAIIHVLRAFDDDTIPHVGPIDPLRDLGNVEIDLIVSDLGQIEKRLERVAKDMKKQKTAELEREHALLLRCKEQTEAEKPLREMELTPDEKKLVRGFMFLSQRPILYVLNISESTTLGADVEAAVAKYGLAEAASRPNSGATAICGKVEAELAEMEDDEAAEFLEGYGLTESGLVRLIRKSYELLGLASFFTVGEPETRAWTIPVNCRAQEAAGAIHSDLEKHFIRAETIHWDTLLAAGSEAAARAQGTLRLEGKDYPVKDGDVLNIRHSG